MPRASDGTYSKAPGTTAAPNTVIGSAQFNSTIDDLVTDANTARPVVAGGTGGTTEATARSNLGVALAQTSTTDTTAASGLIVGGFGIGGVGIAPDGDDLDGALYTGVYRVLSTTANTPAGTGPSGSSCIVTRWGASDVQQIFVYRGTTANDVRLYIRQYRAGSWGSWLPATGEIGTNANGRYERWANGALRCISTELTFTRSSNSVANVSWTFPYAFAGNVSVICSLLGRSSSTGDYTGDIDITEISGGLAYNTSNTATTSISLSLIATPGVTWSSGTVVGVRVMAEGYWL